MKTILNKETGLKKPEGYMNRGDLLIVALEMPPHGGFTTKLIKDRVGVLSKIEKANGGDIILENAEFDVVKEAYDSSKWLTLHKDISELSDHLAEVAKQKD